LGWKGTDANSMRKLSRKRVRRKEKDRKAINFILSKKADFPYFTRTEERDGPASGKGKRGGRERLVPKGSDSFCR